MENIKEERKRIKHNFLNQIVFRLDCNGVLDADIEKCLIEVRENIYQCGFVNQSTRTENQTDFEIKTNLNIPNENPFTITNSRANQFFLFLMKRKQKSWKLVKNFYQ